MKLKKYIGEIINGFLIVDSYIVILPSGKKTGRVLLKCQNCGREFERGASVDFEHVKCKCKCKYLEEKEPRDKIIKWQGTEYNQTQFCKLHNISVNKFKYRLNLGLTVEEAIQNEFICKCKICDKEFISNKPTAKYCSKTCTNRGIHKKGKYKDYNCTCVVCGKEFKGSRYNSKTCSEKCNHNYCTAIRKKRYQRLQRLGHYDYSITLEAVYEKFGGRCNICGKQLSFDSDVLSNDYPSIDHMIPLCKGGYHEWNNVQLLCRHCNFKKGSKPTWWIGEIVT